jgi:hypothetical protein
VLRLPSESADARPATCHVDHDRRTTADAVPIAIEWILEREKRLVGHGLDQTNAKDRHRHAPGYDGGFRRNNRLAAVVGDREELK